MNTNYLANACLVAYFNLAILTFALLVNCVPATAQEQVLEEVIVTAQKREQTLSEVPISISTFTAEEIEQRGIDGFEGLSQLAPNFNFYQGYLAGQVNFNVRGLTSSTDNPGIDPSVGFFVDGVYIERPGALIGKLSDIERIEILRGPQGTLYGRNTSAGAVNIYTKNPGEELRGSFHAGVGSYGLIDVRGSVSGPISDGMKASLSGYYEQKDSFLDDITSGDPVGESDTYGVRIKLVGEPSDTFAWTLAADYSKIDSTESPLVGLQQKDLSAIDFSEPNPQVLAQNVLGAPEIRLDPFDYEKEVTPGVDRDDVEQFGASLSADWDLGWAVLTSITAYRDVELIGDVDPDLSAANLFIAGNDNQSDQFTQEVRLASNPGDSAFEYLLGFYYYQSNLLTLGNTLFGEEVFFSIPGQPPIEGFQSSNSTFDVDTEAWALFGQLSYNFTDALKLTYGFRFNDETKEGVINQLPDNGINLDGPNRGAFLLQFPTLTDLRPEPVEDDDLINMVSLNYEYGSANSVYATYAEGLKSGGINSNNILFLSTVTFDKETSTNYEIGVRNTFDNGIRVNAAVFYTEFDDLQISTFDPANPSNIVVLNAGAADIQGVEADMIWAASDALTLNASLAYTDTEYTGDSPPNLNGQSLSRAPELTFAVGAQYNWTLQSGLTAAVRGDYSFTDEQVLDPLLDPRSAIDSYGLLNLRASISAPDESWTLALWGKNVTDEEYLTQAVANPGAAGLLTDPTIPTYIGAIGAPATFGLEYTRRF